MATRHDDDRYQREIKNRQNAAGRFGFVLGCIAALAAVAINLIRAPRPWTVASIALAVLMAALNVPLGIALGLLGERMTRPPKDDQRGRR
jgi:hypothetical protein